MLEIVETVEELTPAWLSLALGAQVTSVAATRVGTGQMGACYRLVLTGDVSLPTTVLVKLPAGGTASRDLVAGAYRGELRFYADLAPTLEIRVPDVYYSAMSSDSGAFVLLMEDLAPAEQGDQIAGCSVAQAHDAVANLAGLHGPRWGDPVVPTLEGLAPSTGEDADMLAELFGPTVEIFVEGLGELLSPADVSTLRECPAVSRTWVLAHPERWGLVHGDYRLDNLMFQPAGAPGCVALDWQTLSFALPARDLAYFVGTSLDPEVRREHERDLVATYHSALLGYGVAGHSLEECWDDYRLGMIAAPLVSVFGCAYSTRTDRGDLMFATMIARSCAAIRDLGTLTHPSLG